MYKLYIYSIQYIEYYIVCVITQNVDYKEVITYAAMGPFILVHSFIYVLGQ